MNKCFSIIVFMFLLSFYCSGQNMQIDKLNRFLQTRFDSCIVYQSYSNWIYPQQFFIIGKNKANVLYYTYKPPLDDTTSISINNKYLRIHKPKISNDYWQQLIISNIWTTEHYIKRELKIKKDSLITTYSIFDGGEHDFYFITKDQIRRLYFYAPEFYNEHAPDKKLPNALKAIKLFRNIFKD